MRSAAWLFFALLTGCGEVLLPDAGASSDGGGDAGVDAAHARDAGEPDLGHADLGTTDAGEVPDADGGLSSLVRVRLRRAGPGLGRVDGLDALCAPECTVEVEAGRALTLTAVPAAGARFEGWSGACAGQTCDLAPLEDIEITATWSVVTPQLTQAPGGHLCALLAPRSVRCWGNGPWGQLGRQSNENIGDDETIASQGDLPLGLDIVQVAAGGTFTCILQRGGTVRCWGLNDFGQLGRGDRRSVGNEGGAAPANIDDIELGGVALQIALGGWHACALMATGSIRCWGRGLEGQLGYGDTRNVADGSTPLTSPALAGDLDFEGRRARFVAAGAYHSCAVFEDDSVRCWGGNDGGELGYPFSDRVGDGNARRPLPKDAGSLALGLEPVAALALGTEMTCARFLAGRVKCWGRNDLGQLGTGDFERVGGDAGRRLSEGSDVLLGTDAIDRLRVGADHVCGITAGRVRCWGSGAFGKRGDETTDPRATPTPPLDLGAGQAVSLGTAGLNACAILDTGAGLATRCWGRGSTGGLGTGRTTDVGHAPGTMPPLDTPMF